MRYLIFLLLLTSCYQDTYEKQKERNNNSIKNTDPKDPYIVCFLFEKDGVKVYRFWDNERYHYFTSKGETISTKKTCKNNHREENIVYQE